ncbi:bifunctional diguanylate cyclase/phosphodiesterase [Modestobacter sp. Leaf380]|uniref:putative bifunctional diguanylate cyclase/phosphodiesterase n=1 Tax=Modestobacter sp. Leaf380 TaxID=1736356 RepID=UPI000B0EB081|nr:EAL domain-containing protein [Modestobacter sp. Leaf380]
MLTEVPLPLRDRRDGGSRPGAHPAARTVRETRGLLTVIAGALLLSGLDALLGAGTGLRTGPAVLAVLSGATAVVLVRGARARGADGRPWTAFAAACALISLGQTLSAVRGVGVNTTSAGVQDLPLLLAVPCALLACARLVEGGGPRSADSRVWLDAAVVLVAVAVLGEVVVHDALAGSVADVDTLVSVGYPAVGALLCAVGLLTFATAPARRRAAAAWLMTAWLALGVVAVSGAIAVALGLRVLDLVTVVAWSVMLAAGLLAAAADSGTPEASVQTQLPLAGVVFSYCAASGVGVLLVCGVAVGRPVSGLEAVAASLLLVLTLARSLLWAVDGARLTRRLARTESWFRSLVLDTDDVTVVLDDAGRMGWVSESVRPRLGWTPRELAGRRLTDVVHPADAAAVRAAVATPGGGQGFRLRTRAGEWREVESVGGGALGGDTGQGRVLHLRDVTARRDAERELERMAFTDYLTGLPNRARLTAALTAARARTGDGEVASLLLLDLDGFKAVNDVAGHEAGDLLLVEVADRLRDLVREPDLVARLGGDEFAVLVRSGLEDAAALARRVVAGLDRDHQATGPDGAHDGPVFAVAGSIGVTELRPQDDVATTLRQADLALRAAKAAGKGRVRSHGDAADAATTRRTRLAHDLPAALAGDQLRVVYQPVVGLAERRVLGLEALVRWDHPDLGEVGPDEFVPLAEDDGLIVPLQRWVLGRACTEVAGWLAAGRDLQLGVNISVRHLQAGCLVPDVAAALAASGLPAHRLMLEVTESVLMSEQDRLGSDLQTLHDLGCVVSLDDFGRGYSSFAYLARLPVDVLKMDREFLAGIETDERGAAVVQSVIELGRRLSIDVVAEGVETPGELAALVDLGCRFVQGFLLARPTEAADLPGVIDAFDPTVLDRPTVRTVPSHGVGRAG